MRYRSSHKTKPNPAAEKQITIQILMFGDQLQLNTEERLSQVVSLPNLMIFNTLIFRNKIIIPTC